MAQCLRFNSGSLNLGTTAENIVFAGDSAGGNLVLSVALRAGMYGLKMPNSIVTMYPACIVRYSASPARLMSVRMRHFTLMLFKFSCRELL